MVGIFGVDSSAMGGARLAIAWQRFGVDANSVKCVVLPSSGRSPRGECASWHHSGPSGHRVMRTSHLAFEVLIWLFYVVYFILISEVGLSSQISHYGGVFSYSCVVVSV